MHKVNRPTNVNKTCNAFLVVKRLKTTTVMHSCEHSLRSLVKH